MGVAAIQDSTFEWREEGAQVTALSRARTAIVSSDPAVAGIFLFQS